MSWPLLPTDYTDRTWEGLQKYTQINNPDGTVSFMDVTAYLQQEKSFFAAIDANRINAAINAIMGALEGGTDLYEEFREFFDTQETLFEEQGNAQLYMFQVFLDQLRGTANQDITKMKNDYTAEITAFENTQEQLFNQWFQMVKDQLSEDVAGHLQNEIDELAAHIHNLAIKVNVVDTVGAASGTEIYFRNTTSGNIYTITDLTSILYLTEKGTYNITCNNQSYMVAPATFSIDHDDVMESMTFRLTDDNGLAFVGGYVGAYVNH